MAITYQDIKNIVKDIIQLQTETQSFITENVVLLAYPDMIEEIGLTQYDLYRAEDSSFSSAELNLLKFAEACYVISHLFFANHKLIPELSKAVYQQYGEGNNTQSPTDEITRMSNYWKKRAQKYIYSYKNQLGTKPKDFYIPDVNIWGDSSS